MRLALLLCGVILFGGCTAGRTVSPEGTTGGPELAPGIGSREFPAEVFEELAELRRTRPARAVLAADSLIAASVPIPDFKEGDIRDLASFYASVAEDERAASLLLAWSAGRELSGGSRGLLRETTRRLSVQELERLAVVPSSPEDRSTVLAQLAHALALIGSGDSASRVAGHVLERKAEGRDRELAEEVLDGEVPPLAIPLRLGVILPLSGRFEAVGSEILAGIQLALLEHRSSGGGPEVELLVADDSSRVDRAVEVLRELEEEGVEAVAGPLLSESLREVAAARRDLGLSILSPTATVDSGLEYNAYSLWSRVRRQTNAASTLARWMSEQLGLKRIGLLYPSADSTGVAAVLDALREGPSSVLAAAVAYDADSTTFEAPIDRLAGSELEGVIVLADNPRTVLQLAPQLVYYGLRSKVIGGGEQWSAPSVLRRLERSFADYRLVATPVDRTVDGARWQAFRTSYEKEYRKALPNNMFAALGYDVASLLLSHLPEGGLPRPGALTRQLHRTRDAEGATGIFSYDPMEGALSRRLQVRIIQDHRLHEPDPGAILTWVEEQRALEELMRERAEEEERRREGGAPTGRRSGELRSPRAGRDGDTP